MPGKPSGMRIRGAGRGRKSLAARADRHELYEAAVQDPPTEVELVARQFKRLRKRRGLTLREDFCGTGVFSLAWAQSHKEREAWGLDLDRETLDWGTVQRLRPAGEAVGARVHLLERNVMTGLRKRVDLVCAFNFSYWIFKTRAELLRYFKAARRGLVDDGLFFLDAFGGTEVPMRDRNERSERGFVYEWEHEHFDALTNELRCAIHFSFSDGSKIERAFAYDWRMWTLPEIKELLLEAGFSKVRFLWERSDEDGDGTGAYYEPKTADNEGLWWAYIVAER